MDLLDIQLARIAEAASLSKDGWARPSKPGVVGRGSLVNQERSGTYSWAEILNKYWHGDRYALAERLQTFHFEPNKPKSALELLAESTVD